MNLHHIRVSPVELGPHGSWAVRLVADGGEVPAYEYSSKPHCYAWAMGAHAALSGEDEPHLANPYADDRLDSRGRISLGRRGFRNAWRRGFDGATEAMKRFPAP